MPATISIGIDPYIDLGPIRLAWHGLMIAVGIAVGGLAAALDARRRGLEPERLYAVGAIVGVGALVGGRAVYLLEHGRLDDPARGSGARGSRFTAASSPRR
jgi:phosphatidylglycerol---prolipoprotein diacylglyceryl transferase